MVEKIILSKLNSFFSKKKIKRAGIFGSYARGKQRKNSDIDILIEISDKHSLLDLVRMKRELEKKLKKQVDLVEYSTLHPALRESALKEEVRII